MNTMKNLFKLFFVAVLLLAGTTVFAQKFGHIDTQQLISVMPERATAEAELNKVATELEEQQTTMQQEYQQKLTAYIEKRDSLSDVARTTQEADLEGLRQRIQNFQQTAQQQFQQKQAELFKPIYDKAKEAIETVGKEQGVVYVFDIQPGTPILYKSNESIDMLPLVKAKLGIQ